MNNIFFILIYLLPPLFPLLLLPEEDPLDDEELLDGDEELLDGGEYDLFEGGLYELPLLLLAGGV